MQNNTSNKPRVLHRPPNGWARTKTEDNIEAFAGIVFLFGVAIFISDIFSAVQVVLDWAQHGGI